jgi:glycosyltransferase involved in cell wall biosynthesis
MRLLWLIDSLGPGGAENLMIPMLSNLKNHVDPHVCVLSTRSGNPIAVELEKIGIRIDLIEIKNLRNLKGIWRLYKYIRQSRPDVIHTQLETSDILGTLFGKILGIPSISTIHTLELPSRKIKKYLRNFLRWNILKCFSKYIIVVSDFTRQHYIRLGFDQTKLLTIYNGIELNNFLRDSDPRHLKAGMFGLHDDCVVITTVAVLREMKGIQNMLSAMPKLIDKIPNLYYVIVGDGEYRENLENLSRTLGIVEQVIFLGYRTDIPAILAASDLFAYPSLQDALPTVLMEAMASDVPIVASNIGGVPEIIENDVSGLLVDPGNPSSLVEACFKLLCDHDLSERYTAAAYDVVKNKFDICQQASSILALYKGIVTEEKRK